MNLSDLRNKQTERYPDVEVQEVQLEDNVVLAILRGGLFVEDHRKYMDEVTNWYIDGCKECKQFIEIYLDNYWVRVLLFDYSYITGWEPIKVKGLEDVMEKRYLNGNVVILSGGYKSENPKAHMDYAVSEIVAHRMFNEYIEINLQNYWDRIVIFDVNADWRKLSDSI